MESYEIKKENQNKIFEILQKLQSTAKMVRRNIYDVGTSFDIETTQINTDDVHNAYMYIWQFAINDTVFYGRTWDLFLKFYLLLVKAFKLGKPIESKAKVKPNYKMICLVHNLSFEFSFIAQRLPWGIKKTKTGRAPMIFTKDYHNVVTAATLHGLEFRCTLNLTGKSLEKLADDYQLNARKLSGSLDYSKPRNSLTPLSNNELNYCFYDVLILTEYFNKFYSPTYLHNGRKIPTTKTSIIRNELKEHFNNLKKRGLCDYPVGFPETEEMYKYIMNWVYRGGYTHANASYTAVELNELLESYDFKSSYPARVLLADKYLYPYKFEKYTGSVLKALNNHENTATIVMCRFHNLVSKTTHSLESLHKCMNRNSPEYHKNVYVDNGRISKAEILTVALTEIDFLNYRDCYRFDRVEFIGTVYTSKKQRLPDYLIDLTAKYYYIKNTIDESKFPIEYMLSKENVNCIYGMCCSSIFHDNLVWYGKTFELEPATRTYEEMREKQILLPQWGVYISAYSRRAEIERMIYLKHDAVYGDTDSWKVRNPEKHRANMEEYNRIMRESLMNTNFSGCDFDFIGCKNELDLKNKIVGIGSFTKESVINRFKTLGCKRYIMYEKKKDEYKLIVKCAGMKSKKFIEKMKNENRDDDYIFNVFDNNLKLLPTESGKKAHAYNHEKHTDVIIDEYGNVETMGELSSVCLFDIPFSMKTNVDYIEFYLYLQSKKERKY